MEPLGSEEKACRVTGTFEFNDTGVYRGGPTLPFLDARSRVSTGVYGDLVTYQVVVWDGDVGWRAHLVRSHDDPIRLGRTEVSRFTALVGGADTINAFKWGPTPGDHPVDKLAVDGSGGRIATEVNGLVSVAWDLSLDCT